MLSQGLISQAMQVKERGYFGIATYNSYNNHNLSCLMRSAHIFKADFVLIIGGKYKRYRADTTNASAHVPTFEIAEEELEKFTPKGCERIAVELCDETQDIRSFAHPERGIYILGPENGSLSDNIMNLCKYKIRIPGIYSLNQAVAGSIVMYDRSKFFATK